MFDACQQCVLNHDIQTDRTTRHNSLSTTAATTGKPKLGNRGKRRGFPITSRGGHRGVPSQASPVLVNTSQFPSCPPAHAHSNAWKHFIHCSRKLLRARK